MLTNNLIQSGLRAVLNLTGLIMLSLPLKCQDKKEETTSAVRGLMFQSSLPLTVYEGKVVQYSKTLYIYESGVDIAIQYPIEHQRSKITVNKDGDIISDELQELFTSYKYILYQRGDSLGLHYDSLDDINPLLLPVDSLLISHGVYNSGKLFRKIRDSMTLISTIRDSANMVMTHMCIPAPGTKIRISDSIILEYSKQLDEYDFSLPGTGKLSTGTKLSRLQLIINPIVDSALEIERYRREMVFVLTKSVTYLEDIRHLLKDFRSRDRPLQ